MDGNLYGKRDSLWIKWVHCYYKKNANILSIPIRNICLWILQEILKRRFFMHQQHIWQQVAEDKKFRTKYVYHNLKETQPIVQWRKLMFNNAFRPRALFILWLPCHNKFVTNDRLHRFGMLDNLHGCFCDQQETI